MELICSKELYVYNVDMNTELIKERNIRVMSQFFIKYNKDLSPDDLNLLQLRSIYVSNDIKLNRLRLLGSVKEDGITKKIQLAKVNSKQIKKMSEKQFKQTLIEFEYVAMIMQQLKLMLDFEVLEVIINSKYSDFGDIL